MRAATFSPLSLLLLLLPPPPPSRATFLRHGVLKHFPGHGRFIGEVALYDPLKPSPFRIVYEDGDGEDVKQEELLRLMSAFDTAQQSPPAVPAPPSGDSHGTMSEPGNREGARRDEPRRRTPLANELLGLRRHVPLSELGGSSLDDELVEVIVEKVSVRGGVPHLHLRITEDEHDNGRLVLMTKGDFLSFQ